MKKLLGVVALFCCSLTVISAQMTPMMQMAPPAVGETMKDFTLAKLDGTKISLSGFTKTGPVVVVMLRGWVGYQCPYCNRQVGDFITNAKELSAHGTNVIFIYPGSADMVQVKAEDFVSGKTVPANMHFVTDPELKMVDMLHLRWDAKGETSYPSTFLVDKAGVIRYAKISRSHADRAPAADVIAEIAKLKIM
jgi:peroxiredoxin